MRTVSECTPKRIISANEPHTVQRFANEYASHLYNAALLAPTQIEADMLWNLYQKAANDVAGLEQSK